MLKQIGMESLTDIDLSGCSLTQLDNTEVTEVTADWLLVLFGPSTAGQGEANPSNAEKPEMKRLCGEKHPSLTMPAACAEGRCRQKCKKVTDSQREELNSKVNFLEWTVRAQWYRTHVHEVHVKIST